MAGSNTTMLLKCSCGTVRGLVKNAGPDGGTRIVCMCNDCQAYAHWLGRPQDVLDAHGGTDIYQLAPAQIELTAGRDQIRCIRLGPKGMLRWYTACCRTPIANQLESPKIPFAGMPIAIFERAQDGRSREETLGPIRAHVYAAHAISTPPAGAHDKIPMGLLFRSIGQLLRGLFKGAHAPSPFYDFTTQKRVSEPVVLTPEEREELRRKQRSGQN